MGHIKRVSIFAGLVCCLSFPFVIAHGQTTWPQTLTTQDGAIIKLYQLQPDSFRDNSLSFHAAFSLLEYGKTDPLFGSFQADAIVETDRDNRLVNIVHVKMQHVNLPGIDPAAIRKLNAFLESGTAALGITIPLDELLSSLDMQSAEKDLSRDLRNQPPRIIYTTHPSILVIIDGEPRVQLNKDLGMEAVVNTPFTILRHQNSWYLYGGRHWYAAISPTGPYSYTSSIPATLSQVQAAIDRADSASSSHSDTAREGADIIAAIVVSTVPAELIQSNGDPQFVPVDGTGLLYVSNSNNDLFVHTPSQSWFVLLSGRWYKAPGLEGDWRYVPADSLPPDFARIPEGSPKDNVLASVAGTPAAREAVIDAQIPQTTRIDRKSATTQVTYDGPPKFVAIRGTNLQYAVNTPTTVLRSHNRYYCVDNGVWFASGDPMGPWTVAEARPNDVELIPPDYPVYTCKYVYVYGSTPDYIYMGYTPGYLNSFIYGPTLVYGTGYYYEPWWGSVYYPRPCTWGFNLWYDPWYGWTFGYDLGLDWFNFGIGWGWGFWTGGWWGPWIYRPPYVWHHFRGHGLYERDIRREENTNHRNNLYASRADISRQQQPEHIYSGRDGNIYRRQDDGSWQQRDGNQWKKMDGRPGPALQDLNRQEQLRQRGQMRIQNFQQLRGGGGSFFRGGSNVRPGRH